MSPEAPLHNSIAWVRWSEILAAVAIVARLAVWLWRFASQWKIVPGVTLNATVSPRSIRSPAETAAGNDAAAHGLHYGPFRISVKPAVLTTRVTAHSVDEIPQAMLDALSPEQRKLVLDRLPGVAQGGAAGPAPAAPKNQ
jgi:hypothetical protein